MGQTTEELNYVGTTKQQLWALLKEKEAEQAKKGNGTSTTTEAANVKRIEDAFARVDALDIKEVKENLLSVVDIFERKQQELIALQDAIAETQKQLKDVHGFEAAANSAVAMLEAKKQMAEDADAQVVTMIDNAEEQRDEILTKAREEAQAIRNKIAEEKAEYEKTRKRTEEEWAYNFNRAKQAKTDEVQDELSAKVKLIIEREEAVKAREDKMDEMENEISTLQGQLEAAEELTEERVEEAKEAAKAAAEKSFTFQKTIITKDFEGKLGRLEENRDSLQKALTAAEARINALEAQIGGANERVTTIATEAMRARADAATITDVAKTVGSAAAGKK